MDETGGGAATRATRSPESRPRGRSTAGRRGRGRSALLSALLSTLTLAGTPACTRERDQPEPGVLTVCQLTMPIWKRNFNPLLPQEEQLWPSKAGVYEPLVVYSVTRGEFLPWLASSYAWRDEAKTLEFTVRDGVLWSDGTPFTARDVAFTFELMKKHSALDLYQVWKRLEGVSVSEGNKVTFAFKEPFIPALTYVGHQPIVPEHIWRDVEDPVTFTNPNPVATGPFTEVRVFRNQVYELGRNPHYWQPGKPRVAALRMPAYAGNDQVNLALVNGEVDWAGSFVPAIDRIFTGRNPEHHHYWFPLVDGSVLLYANTTRKPFDDVRVRKALSMALDRDLVVKVAMYGYTRPADATALSDAYQRVHSDDAARAGASWMRHDVEGANRLLDEAGYPRAPSEDGKGLRRTATGEPLAYDIIVAAGWSDWVRAAQIVARSLREVGIDARLRTYDFTAWFEKLQNGEYDLSLGWTEEGATPYEIYRGLMSTHTVPEPGEPAEINWHRYGSARADALLAELARTADPTRQAELATELQRAFATEVPAIPLFLGPSWGQYNTARFTGFPSATNPYAALSPSKAPEVLLVLTEVAPRAPGAPSSDGSAESGQAAPALKRGVAE